MSFRVISASIAAALVCAPAVMAAPAALQPCVELAAYARTLPASAWSKGGARALAPMLRINHPDGAPKTTQFETALAKSPMVRKALGVEDADTNLEVDHLSGTDLYAVSSIQGTLECQDTVFAKAAPGRPVRLIDGPPTLNELCWTQSADFGEVSGQAVYVAHGAISQVDDDEDLVLTPWASSGWGPACRVELRYRTNFAITDRYCGDKTVCDAAGNVARDIAFAYGAHRKNYRDNTAFTWGPKPSPQATAVIQSLKQQFPAAQQKGTETTDFPTFNGNDGLEFSYNGFTLFPLKLDGKAYVAAIGYQGIGWRETNDLLLAVYRLDQGELVPLAGFVIRRSIAGLKSAEAAPPAPVKAH